MKKILIWDLPTRLLHWAFAISASAALVIALAVDDDSPAFRLHMIFGLVALSMVALRLIWGWVGTRHARLSCFPLRPLDLLRYLKGALSMSAPRYTAHNPGTAWAAVGMYILAALLVATGLGNEVEFLEESHEPLAYALLALIILHLAGLAWHTLSHKEFIAGSMVTGMKEGNPDEEISSSRPISALVIVLAAAMWISALFMGYDPQTATLKIPLLGTAIHLGEEAH